MNFKSLTQKKECLKATLIQQIHIAANEKKDFPISMIDSIEFVCSNSQTSQDMEK